LQTFFGVFRVFWNIEYVRTKIIMNFVAIIGIVDQLKKDNENKQTIITVNCEKPTANVGDEN
jgi:hypothetical protein